MSSWMNRFVAGPDGGPVVALRLGPTLSGLAGSEISNLEPTGAPSSGDRCDVHHEWSGQLVAWLEFVDRCGEAAAAGDDEDLAMFVRWLDEDLDAAIDAFDRAGVPS